MNYVSLLIAALPQILSIVEELVAAGKSVHDAQNAVQSHEAVRTAHPEVRAAVNTLVAHLVNEHQEKAAKLAEVQPEQQAPGEKPGTTWPSPE